MEAMRLFLERKPRDGRLLSLPIGVIHPSRWQPRTVFDEDELSGLSESIRRNGLLQPITVRRRDDGGWELIAGERRLRAARLAGLAEVPCIEMRADDRKAAILGLIENVQRQNLNIFEEAEAIRRLMTEWGVTQLELAQRLGKAQSTVANKLRLLRLNEEQRRRILASHLSERHARALLRLDEDSERDEVLNEMIARQMTAAEAEAYVEQLLSPTSGGARCVRVPVVRDVRIFVNTLTRAVDSIRRSGLDARSAETETDDYIEYTVIIPKNFLKP